MKLRKKPFYLLFFAIYPSLAIMGMNVGRSNLDTAFRPLVFSIGFTLITFLFILILTKRIHLAAGLTLVILIAFFSYGHVFSFFAGIRPFGIKLSRTSLLLPTYLILVIISITLILRNRRSMQTVTPYLNIIALVLLIFPAYQISNYLIEQMKPIQKNLTNGNGLYLETIPQGVKKPDIYVIVLDGYNRDDTLQSYFGYDNSGFIKGLTDMGFYVARCSMSNYNQSRLVLASEFNLDYMDNFFPGEEKISFKQIGNNILGENLFRNLLSNSGYEVYTYKNSYYPFLDWPDIEHELQSGTSNPWTRDLTEFETMFINSTVLEIFSSHNPEIIDKLQNFNSFDPENSSENSKNLTQYILKTLPEISNDHGPKFVYAHFTVTHRPFYFAPDGSMLDNKFRAPGLSDAVFIEGYRDQVEFINPRIIEVIKQILATSKEPPIIILQSDHGMKNDFKGNFNRPNQILAAFYLPGITEKPYSTISPVNFLRFILNKYFQYNLPLLKDVSFQIDPDDYSLHPTKESNPTCIKQ